MGNVSITTTTTGATPRGGHDIYWDFEWPTAIDPNGTTVVQLAVGQYWPQLSPAPNCISRNGALGAVDVRPAETRDLALEIVCEPAGWIVAVVSASGEDVPTYVSVDLFRTPPHPNVTGFGVAPVSVSPRGMAPMVVAAGDWSGELKVPTNCTVSTTNPVQFSVAENQTTVIRFDVACERRAPETGTLRVALTTTGTRSPAGTFYVGFSGMCDPLDEWGFAYCSAVPASGIVSLTFRPGDVWVEMLGPANCTCHPHILSWRA